MAENSKIQWTNHTFNPWVGCAKVHTGCQACYAEELMANRYHRVVWGPGGTRVKTKTWRDPLKWNKLAEQVGERHRVFCASLADLFERRDELVPWRAELFQLIDRTPHLDWLLLTKRPENVPSMWYSQTHYDESGQRWGDCVLTRQVFRRENVWLGTSISDQATADEWTPRLLALRGYAKVLFLSVEPIVGPIDLSRWLIPWHGMHSQHDAPDWVVVGGESKQGQHEPRPCDVGWIRAIVNQCRETGVAAFVKQLGTNPRWSPVLGPCGLWPEHVRFDYEKRGDESRHRIRLRDSHGGDIDEWASDLRVRCFPNVEALRSCTSNTNALACLRAGVRFTATAPAKTERKR